MKRLVLAIALLLVLPASGAAADGGPSPGVLTGWDGVLSPDGAVRYVTLNSQGGWTNVAAVRVRGGRILRFNGVRGFYNGTKGTFGNAEWDVVGPTGRIRISGNVAELWTAEQGTGQQVSRPFPATMVMTGAIQGAFEELIRVLEHGGTTRSTAREARMTVEILVAMLASQQQGNRLVSLPLSEG